VNLLLPQHKNVKDPGDSKEMASARREFLGTGAYEPLRDGLCKAVADSLADFSESGKAPIILDCGCGEGYYTAGIYDNLLNSGISPEIYGIDISKNVLSAAKPRFVGKKIYCAVASCFRLPLPSESVDLATVIFAPFCREELLRTLKTGGIAVTAIPAREHLYELKELLYKEPYYNSVKPYETDGFDFIGKSEIAYNLTIDSQEILNALFMMTPYFYKTSREDSNRLYSYFGTNDKFTTRIAFEILTYVKK
jgi:23S rRNA (guanine745-N1)-methyltransferase